jgi:tetratricopeptide (TPR) repeat protein
MSTPNLALKIAAALHLAPPAGHPQFALLQSMLNSVRERLAAGPGDAAALGDLIVWCLECAVAGLAAELAEEVVRLHPNDPRLHYLRGRSLRGLGQVADAIASYGEATRLAPGFVDAWLSLGLAYRQAGALTHALEALLEANRLAPARADVFVNLGHLGAQRLAWPGAEEAYRNALLLEPDNLPARIGLARAEVQLWRPAEALATLDALPAAAAGSFLALRVRARAYYLLGQVEAAQATLAEAWRVGLGSGVDANTLHQELVVNCEYPDAGVPLMQQLLALHPDEPALRRFHVDSLIRALRLTEAAAVLGLERGFAHLDPSHYESLMGLGEMCQDRERCAGIAEFLLSTPAGSDTAGEKAGLAQLLLKLGRFREAATPMLRRRVSSDASFRGSGHERPRLWRGEPLAGKHLVVWKEQGHGDTLQMLRFLPHLKALGPARLSYLANAALRPLIEALPEVDAVLDIPEQGADADYHLPDLNLIAHFVRDEADIPSRVPYLVADPALRQRWRERLGPRDGRRRVALTWAGNPNMGLDRARSVPTTALAALGGVPGIRWLALQKGPLRAETAGPLPFVAEDLSAEVDDFAQTAALLAEVDLLICVDTAVAHLAGALGRPVWLLNRSTSEYRWQLGRDDSPWYPSMRIFNQRQPFDWEPVVAELAHCLQSLDRA